MDPVGDEELPDGHPGDPPQRHGVVRTVISPAPKGEQAGDLFDGFAKLTAYPGFFEGQADADGGPDLRLTPDVGRRLSVSRSGFSKCSTGEGAARPVVLGSRFEGLGESAGSAMLTACARSHRGRSRGLRPEGVPGQELSGAGYRGHRPRRAFYDAADDYPIFVLPCAEAVAADAESRGIVAGRFRQRRADRRQQGQGRPGGAGLQHGDGAAGPQHNDARIVALGGRMQSLRVPSRW